MDNGIVGEEFNRLFVSKVFLTIMVKDVLLSEATSLIQVHVNEKKFA